MPETIDTSNMTPEQIMELQKQKCPFCQIVSGKIPSKKVYEDDKILAVLDINPIAKGHVLVMPKEHYPIMPLIPEDLLSHLFKITKHISQACLKKIPCQGTNIFIANGGIAGQTAYHFMVFIIPRDEGDGISNFELPKIEVDEKELSELIPGLRNNINIMLKEKLLKNPIPGRDPPKIETPEVTEEQLIKVIEQNPQLKQVLATNTEQFKQLIKTNAQLKMLFEGKDVDKIINKIKGDDVEIIEPKVNLDAIAEVIEGGNNMKKEKDDKEDEKEIEEDKIEEEKEAKSEDDEETKEEEENTEEKDEEEAKNEDDEETKEEDDAGESGEDEDTKEDKVEKETKKVKTKKKKPKNKKHKTEKQDNKGIDLDQIADLFS